MKKLIALALTLCLALTLFAACGGNSTPATTAATAAADGKLQTIEPGKLIMATNAAFPPYEMVADGKGVGDTGFEGIDVEIALAIANKLGLKLQIDDMEFDAALIAVQNKKCDVILAGLTYKEDRDKLMDFSTPYAQGVQVIIVKEGSEIKSVDDLKNAKLIGTQRGTTGYIYCADEFGEDHVNSYDNGAMATQALENGQVDCVVIDNGPAKEFVKQNSNLKILDSKYVTEDYCIAMSEGNGAMQNAINDALKELTADGTIQAILDKYIKAE